MLLRHDILLGFEILLLYHCQFVFSQDCKDANWCLTYKYLCPDITLVRRNCPIACGICEIDCKDDPRVSCPLMKQARGCISASVRELCPLSCGVCGVPTDMTTCTGSGDPHYVTFDKKKFDFQGDCSYTFARYSGTEHEEFDIEVFNIHRGGEISVSWLDRAVVRMYGDVINLNPHLQIKVNGEVMNLPYTSPSKYTIQRQGRFSILKAANQLEVKYDGQYLLVVSVPREYFANKLEGLCGNFDGNPKNDIVVDGVEDPIAHGNRYLTPSKSDCLPAEDMKENECSKPANTQRYRHDCEIINDPDGPFESCHARIKPANYLADCLFDLCVYGGVKTALEQAVAAYHQACNEESVQIKSWREDTGTPLACQPNSKYLTCVSPCPATCVNMRPTCSNSNERCVEGCECSEGYVQSGDLCVETTQCGCSYEGKYYLPEESFLQDSCSKQCKCRNQRMTCVNTQCGQHETCGRDDKGRQSCRPMKYSNWSAYSACSDICGGGVHSRTRTCNFGSCDKHLEEIKNCNEQLCGPTDCVPDLRSDCSFLTKFNECPRFRQGCSTTCCFDMAFGPQWSGFGPCSVDCGVGLKTRRRGWVIHQSITCIVPACEPSGNRQTNLTRCTGSGDPHYTTFDKKKFDFQGNCSYTFARYSGSEHEEFDIEVFNKHLLGKITVSWLDRAVLRMYGDIVNLNPGLQIKVNEEVVNLPYTSLSKYSIEKEGRFAYVKAANGLEVKVDGNHLIVVSVPPQYFGDKLEGLCGNFDGNPANDIVVNGVEDHIAHGNRYRTTSKSDCVLVEDLEENECLKPANTQRYRHDCAIITDANGPFESCHARVKPANYFADCMFDVCVYGGAKTALEQAVAAYSQACNEEGARIKAWRAITGTPLDCPPNSEYSSCASPCASTCMNMIPTCGEGCVEGCECSEGYVWSGDRCVKTAQCGCSFEGKYYLAGESFLQDSCSKRCMCRNQRMSCINTRCLQHETCGTDDKGRQACRSIDWSACSVTCGDGIQKKLDDATGQYMTRHCKIRNCDIPTSCPSDQELRFKNPAECCVKTSPTGKWCDRPAVSSYIFARQIIGGFRSRPGDFPWMVFFQGTGNCTGAIISKKFILTAAYCIRRGNSARQNPRVVYSGTTDLGDSSNLKQLKVLRSIIHPQYQTRTQALAMLELEDELQFNQNMRPICLPHGEEVPYDSTCIAMGWGIFVNNLAQHTNRLQNVPVKVFDPDVCHHWREHSHYSDSIRKMALCAGDLIDDRASCLGSSGLLLVCQRCDSCGWFVAGVASYNWMRCGTKEQPRSYTNVVEYEDWIYASTGETKETRGC